MAKNQIVNFSQGGEEATSFTMGHTKMSLFSLSRIKPSSDKMCVYAPAYYSSVDHLGQAKRELSTENKLIKSFVMPALKITDNNIKSLQRCPTKPCVVVIKLYIK